MSNLIAKSFINELISQTDIVELIDSYLPLKKQGHSYVACCPFHQEKSPSFNVVTKKQFYHCFGCGASGNVIIFIMNYLHLSFTEAVSLLAARLGLEVIYEGNNSKKLETGPDLYNFLAQVSKFYQKKLASSELAINYLKSRQVTGQIAKQYLLGYAPVGWQNLENYFKKNKSELLATGMIISGDQNKTYDRYRHRIIFPIQDRHGRIIGFGGRSIDPTQKPKYLNSPETVLFHKSREVYGLYQIISSKKNIDNIIIVEGYMDVIALAQHGVTNVVATLGTSTSEHHIQLLNKYTKQLLFCFDGDEAGKQAAWRALETTLPYLNNGLDVSFIFLPDGEDPDSLIRKEGSAAFQSCVEKAIPCHKFLISKLSPLNMQDLAGKNQLINAIKPYISKIAAGPYQDLLINELAQISRIEVHRLNQLLNNNDVNVAESQYNSIKRSPSRIALAILLQHPELYKQCQRINVNLLDDKKYRILIQLVKEIEKNPNINTAQLIELWRDTPIFDKIVKLINWDHKVPENVLLSELNDIMLFLCKKNTELKIETLLEKARNNGLTAKERIELQEMLKNRHINKIC